MSRPLRNLVLIFGDQLQHDSAALDDFDIQQDSLWMAEVEEEITYVWSHQLRIAMFLSAMRHFREECQDRDRPIEYHELNPTSDSDRGKSFIEILKQDLKRLKPQKVIFVQPGDYRVWNTIRELLEQADVEYEVRPDRHFYCSPQEFLEYSAGKKELRLEYFYRWLRKKHNVLMDQDGQPEGGQWNFDHDNREAFGKSGPESKLAPRQFRPDEITQQVIELVRQRYPKHPGSLESFDLPVTRTEALKKLRHFITERLDNFGRYEDAMWTDQTYLYHSHLSACLNLKLISPRECIEKAVEAYYSGEAALNSVEGFVRQILGWREFIRGIYWTHMPDYAELNALEAESELPQFYWDGATDLNCVRESMRHVRLHAYSHHIHRLMILGNLSQTLGVHPYRFHEWHMAMYLDAIDWVSLPNTLGMSQFGDGGIVGTKPYCSTGNYVNKMSNFCRNCQYDYKKKVGEDACPLTTFYWDFLDRNYEQLKENPRMKFAIQNVQKLRKKPAELEEVRQRANSLREQWGCQKSSPK
ncbi:MAG: cryptochrome/photolyase family protein [Planctomycetaceae bacterium]|nr:cryptochrome/photolyase family protein [Planctomycetaceae bacterium]